jgi:hypothetical protein
MSDQQKSKTQQYSVSISPVLYNKLDQHVFILRKLLGIHRTKKDWLIAAIEEKLEREAAENNYGKAKRISFKIDPLTKKKLDERIQNIRKLRDTFSKKQWVLDAIQERLDQEEEKVRKELQEYQLALTDTR